MQSHMKFVKSVSIIGCECSGGARAAAVPHGGRKGRRYIHYSNESHSRTLREGASEHLSKHFFSKSDPSCVYHL